MYASDPASGDMATATYGVFGQPGEIESSDISQEAVSEAEERILREPAEINRPGMPSRYECENRIRYSKCGQTAQLPSMKLII